MPRFLMTTVAVAALGATVGACAPATLQAAPATASAAANASSPRNVVPLATGWRFTQGDKAASAPDASDADWQQVSVPHTWNRIGKYDPAAHIAVPGRKVDDYAGVAWYRLHFTAPPAKDGERTWLEFDAASRTAEVWLNGVKLGSHDGGFSRFRFDATDAIRPGEENVLAVKVDNSKPEPGNATADTLPLAGDFFVQGGLYRPVRLVQTAPAHFAMDDFGGPGVYVTTQSIGSDDATVSVLSKLTNDGKKPLQGSVVTRLIATDGSVAAEARSPATLAAGGQVDVNQSLDVKSPHLWQGQADPYLYSLVAELRDGDGRVIDSKMQNFGIREFRMDPDKGFFINGKHVALHGVGLHQDSMQSGWAMSKDEVADHVATIRDMGANTIRLAHYEHGQPVHDLADRYGLVLWDEIALVTAWTLDEAQGGPPPAIMKQAKQQLTELIRQNYNHPSVAVWGIANEVDFGPNRPDFLGRPSVKPADPTSMLETLAALAKKEDPSRPATLATCCDREGVKGAPIVAGITPVSAGNRYYGWYYGKVGDLGANLDAMHAARPDQPQGISEYGAGAAISIHTDNPLGGPFNPGGHDQPEAYQAWLHEQTWPIIASRKWLWGSWLWNAFDFGTATRREGDSQDINTKGLVSFDGKVRKDAFYYYRAHWSGQPTVHIKGRHYVDRAYQANNVEVYSNAPSTELLLNGKSLGTLNDCPNMICTWDNVGLANGDNQLEAVGHFADGKTSDKIVWSFDPARRNVYRIDSGALVAVPGFGSDNFFDGGDAASFDQYRRGRPPILAPITPKGSHGLLASYRKGTFGYRLPIAPGSYTVTLHWVAPGADAEQSVFDVDANDNPALQAIDVAKLANAPYSEVTRSFRVLVTGDALSLRFVPRKGDAMVSAIEVKPAQ